MEIATFYIKGKAATSLFNILTDNGYSAQLSKERNSKFYRVDVILKNKEDK